MKTNVYREWFLPLAAVMVLAASVVHAGNNPVWAANIPAPSFTSTGSYLASVTSHSAGSTLAVLSYVDSMAPSGNAGTQLVLIGAHGQVLATGELAVASGLNPSVTTLSVTPRKVVVLINAAPFQGTIDADKHLVFTPLPFASMTEHLVDPTGWTDFDRRALFTTTSVSFKVVEIRRYSVSKLRP